MRPIIPALLAVSVVMAVTASGTAVAQTSSGYKLEEHSLNAGGSPAEGQSPASPGHRISVGSIGQWGALAGLQGNSYSVDGGLLAAFPPPGEVMDLTLEDDLLLWGAERSAGSYNLYRDSLASLSIAQGACEQPSLPSTSTTDVAIPAVGTGYFYLVTVVNRLDEEGTLGANSAGIKRLSGSDCP